MSIFEITHPVKPYAPTLARPESWEAEGTCTQLDPDLFFDAELERIAVAVCKNCPVRLKCAQKALERREEHGVWGGLTEAERSQLVRWAS